MNYIDKITHSQTNGQFVRVSKIWPETSKIEQVGIKACIQGMKELGYNLVKEAEGYHPQWDLKFSNGNTTMLVEVKTEPRAQYEYKWNKDKNKNIIPNIIR